MAFVGLRILCNRSRAAKEWQAQSQHSNSHVKSDYDLLTAPSTFRKWAEAESLEAHITEIELRQTKVTGSHGDVLFVDSTIKLALNAGAVLEIELAVGGKDETSGAYLLSLKIGATATLSKLGLPHRLYPAIASPSLLLAMKRSHLYFPIRWLKHLRDYHDLLPLTLDRPPSSEALFTRRLHESSLMHGYKRDCVVDRNRIHLPWLSKPLLYNDKVDIRAWVKVEEQPILAQLQKEGNGNIVYDASTAMTSRIVNGIVEEACSLALKEKLLPFWGSWEDQNYVAAHKAYLWALEELCTLYFDGFLSALIIDHFPKLERDQLDLIDIGEHIVQAYKTGETPRPRYVVKSAAELQPLLIDLVASAGQNPHTVMPLDCWALLASYTSDICDLLSLRESCKYLAAVFAMGDDVANVWKPIYLNRFPVAACFVVGEMSTLSVGDWRRRTCRRMAHEAGRMKPWKPFAKHLTLVNNTDATKVLRSRYVFLADRTRELDNYATTIDKAAQCRRIIALNGDSTEDLVSDIKPSNDVSENEYSDDERSDNECSSDECSDNQNSDDDSSSESSSNGDPVPKRRKTHEIPTSESEITVLKEASMLLMSAYPIETSTTYVKDPAADGGGFRIDKATVVVYGASMDPVIFNLESKRDERGYMPGDSKMWGYISTETIRICLRLPSGQEHVSKFAEDELTSTLRNWLSLKNAAIHLKLTRFDAIMMLTVLLHLLPARVSDGFASSVKSYLRHR